MRVKSFVIEYKDAAGKNKVFMDIPVIDNLTPKQWSDRVRRQAKRLLGLGNVPGRWKEHDGQWFKFVPRSDREVFFIRPKQE